MKDTTKFEWDKRNQKLIITDNKTVPMTKKGKKSGSKETAIRELYDKKGALTLLTGMKNQVKNMEKFIEDVKKVEENAKDKENLPFYNEIRDVLAVISYETDGRMKQQYTELKPNYDKMVREIAELEKIIPFK